MSQTEDETNGLTTLRIEGVFHLADAQMLENLCLELQREKRRSVGIDLEGITFLDEENARVLRRLKSQPKIRMTGLRWLKKQMIDRADE